MASEVGRRKYPKRSRGVTKLDLVASLSLQEIIMASLKEPPPSTSSSTLASSESASSTILDLLGDDSLIYIFRFLGSTLNEIRTVGNVCSVFKHLLFDSKAGDKLFRYINQDLDDAYRQTLSSGRQYWKNLYNIRQSLSMGASCSTSSNDSNNNVINTVGVLSEEEEAEAICYDNPNYGTSRPSVGYFGFQPLEGGSGSNKHICVWGDFHGLAIVPSMNSLTSNYYYPTTIAAAATSVAPSTENPSQSTVPSLSAPVPVRRRFKVRPRLYTNNFQIMDVIHHPKSKYLFLGNASGLVQSVLVERDNRKVARSSTTATSGGATEYSVISSCLKHSNEVTSLAIASNQHLVSACVDGVVILHMDALLDGDVNTTIQLINTQRLIFSMSSVDISTSSGSGTEIGGKTRTGTDDTATTVLCLGGEERILDTLFWKKTKFDLKSNRRNYTIRDWDETSVATTSNRSHYRRLFRNGRQGHLTNLKFLGRIKPRLVVGTSAGDIAVHDLALSSTTTTEDNSNSASIITNNADGNDYTLSWRYDLTGCCRGGGCVESIDLVGSLLITTGGKDGRVRVWDWNTGSPIASIKIHPGTYLPVLIVVLLMVTKREASLPKPLPPIMLV